MANGFFRPVKKLFLEYSQHALFLLMDLGFMLIWLAVGRQKLALTVLVFQLML